MRFVGGLSSRRPGRGRPGSATEDRTTSNGEFGEKRWLALILLCSAQFVVVLDASIVNVTLPTIKTSLDFSQENLPSRRPLDRHDDLQRRAERNKAFGVWGAVAVAGGAAGVLGGVLTEWAGWEWVLWVNVPVSLIAFALSPRLLAESRAEGETRAFDVAGAVTVTASLSILVYALVDANEAGWGSTQTIGLLALAAALMAAFVGGAGIALLGFVLTLILISNKDSRAHVELGSAAVESA